MCPCWWLIPSFVWNMLPGPWHWAQGSISLDGSQTGGVHSPSKYSF